MSANPDNLRAWIPRQHDRWLDLHLAGRVFGGRSGEAPLQLIDGMYDGTSAQLRFSNGELLRVDLPSGFLTADGGLTIPDAAAATLTWYPYGSAASPEDRCALVYRLVDGLVAVTASGPAARWQEPEQFLLDRNPMVRLA